MKALRRRDGEALAELARRMAEMESPTREQPFDAGRPEALNPERGQPAGQAQPAYGFAAAAARRYDLKL